MSNNEQTMDFDELKKSATNISEVKTPEENDEAELIIAPKKPRIETPSENANGPDPGMGVITDAPRPRPKNPGVPIGPMQNVERSKDVQETMADMDQQIAAHHKHLKEFEKKLEESGQLKGENSTNNSDQTEGKKIEVIIDKFGLWKPEFTPEEQKKIEYAEKIKLTEVTEVKLNTLKVKRKIKDGDMKLVQQTFNRGLTPIIALASGYTCKMNSVSMAEAINLYQNPGTDTAKTINEKWSLIYDKIVDPSIGAFEDYEDFCKKTAFSDYDMFLYGIICTSYPEKDSSQFTCENEKCKKKWTESYVNQELFRPELVTEEQQEYISQIVGTYGSKSAAQEVCAKSVLNNPKVIQLPGSNIIVEMFTPSVYDMIHTYIEELLNADIPNVQDLHDIMGLAVNLRKVWLPVEAGSDEYYLIDETTKIMEALKFFNEYDISILRKCIISYLTPSQLTFGFKKVVCPNCKHDHGMRPVALDDVLFQHVRRRVQQEIE